MDLGDHEFFARHDEVSKNNLKYLVAHLLFFGVNSNAGKLALKSHSILEFGLGK